MESYCEQPEPATVPLDALRPHEIREALSLLRFLRRAGRAWWFLSGTESWRVACRLDDAGYVRLVRDGSVDGVPVYRCEWPPRREVSR
jgi:hypothetical protein